MAARVLTAFAHGSFFGVGAVVATGLVAPNERASALALAAVLGLMTFAPHSHALAIVFVGLLGVAAFATVSPLQMWVLSKADGAGETLASSFNIAAFNLGNALGAWIGGVVIASGPGLPAITWVAMLLPLADCAIALAGMRSRRAASRGPDAVDTGATTPA